MSWLCFIAILESELVHVYAFCIHWTTYMHDTKVPKHTRTPRITSS